MTRDNIFRMYHEAGLKTPWDLMEYQWKFAALVAAEKEQQMIRDGWRQCAKGQRTTQYCGLLDAAVKDEREACAKVAESYEPTCDTCPSGVAAAIRGKVPR